jgi:hypothetical protein
VKTVVPKMEKCVQEQIFTNRYKQLASKVSSK